MKLRPVWRTVLVSGVSRILSRVPVMTASGIGAVATIKSDGEGCREQGVSNPIKILRTFSTRGLAYLVVLM